jgi:hypothetical protein
MGFNIILVCRSMSLWMSIIIFSLLLIVTQNNNGIEKSFYRFGPHSNFVIMGFIIDTYYKYYIVVFYSVFNTIFRTLHVEVLSPWLVNNVQDLERKQNEDIIKYAYEITTISTIYTWVDWVLYMNILLSQIDMVIIEIIINIISTNVTTYVYLNYNNYKQLYSSIP